MAERVCKKVSVCSEREGRNASCWTLRQGPDYLAADVTDMHVDMIYSKSSEYVFIQMPCPLTIITRGGMFDLSVGLCGRARNVGSDGT